MEARRSLTVGGTLAAVVTLTYLVSSASSEDCAKMVNVQDISASQPLSFSVRSGSKICLEDEVNRRTIMKSYFFYGRRRYELAYKTSDYTVRVETVSGGCCRGSDARCTDEYPAYPSSCYQRAQAKALKNPFIAEEPTWKCLEADNFTVPCFQRKLLVRKGPVYKVYQHLEQKVSHSFSLEVKGPDDKATFRLQQNPCLLNLTWVDARLGAVPITVKSSPSLGGSTPLSLLTRGNELYYFVYSSEVGKPVIDPRRRLFGEFQISLEGAGEIYDEKIIGGCRIVNGCDCECDHTEPSSISRFETHKNQYISPEDWAVKVNEDGSIDEQYEADEQALDVQIVLGSVHDGTDILYCDLWRN